MVSKGMWLVGFLERCRTEEWDEGVELSVLLSSWVVCPE
jgi:hypothetical protein